MTAATPTHPPVVATLQRLRAAAGSADRFRVAVGVLVAAQCLWLGLLMARGWYYQADLANLAEATGRPLSWAYLKGPQGGHFAVPGRLLFWLFNRTAPLNYPLTIAFRLVGQAVATVLLARLLVLLVGRCRTVLVVLTLYAFSPLLIQGTLWLSASFGLIGSQLLLIGAVESHIRHGANRRTRDAVLTAVLMLGATLLSEEAAVTVLALPILSLFYLTTGNARERVIATLSYWREWLMIAVPMIGYVLYYFSGSANYGVAAHPLGISHAVRVVVVELTDTVAPGLLGGPWQWFSAGDNYLGLSAPSTATKSVVGAILLAVIGYTVVRQGWKALAAWSIPAVVAAVGIVVVAVGRYDTFGIVIAQQFEHGYFAALPAAIAVVLAWRGLDLDAVRARLRAAAEDVPPDAEQDTLARLLPDGRRSRALTVGVGALLVSSMISGITYTQVWARSPARRYVTTLVHSLQRAGGRPALYDTAVPTSLIPLEAAHHVSDVLGLTGAEADFGYDARKPSLVDSHGRLAPARFYVQTDVDLSAPGFCRFPLQGAVTVTKALRSAPRRNDWYLNISYFQQHAAVVRVSVIDQDGRERLPVYGTDELLHAGLGGIHLLFRSSAPVAVRVRSYSPATNLCIAGAQLGFPYIAKKAGS